MFSIKSPFPEKPKEVLGEIGRILKFFVLTVKKNPNCQTSIWNLLLIPISIVRNMVIDVPTIDE